MRIEYDNTPGRHSIVLRTLDFLGEVKFEFRFVTTSGSTRWATFTASLQLACPPLQQQQQPPPQQHQQLPPNQQVQAMIRKLPGLDVVVPPIGGIVVPMAALLQFRRVGLGRLPTVLVIDKSADIDADGAGQFIVVRPRGGPKSGGTGRLVYRFADQNGVFEGEIRLAFRDVCRSDLAGEGMVYLPPGPYFAPAGNSIGGTVASKFYEWMFGNGGIGSATADDYAMARIRLDGDGLCVQSTEQELGPVRNVLASNLPDVARRAQTVAAPSRPQFAKYAGLLRMLSFNEAARLGELHPGGSARIPTGPEWLVGLVVALEFGPRKLADYAAFSSSYLTEGLHEWVDAEPSAGKRFMLGPSYEEPDNWADRNLDRVNDRSPSIGVRYARTPR